MGKAEMGFHEAVQCLKVPKAAEMKLMPTIVLQSFVGFFCALLAI